MLVVALVLVLLAVGLFVIDFARKAERPLDILGLALFAGGVAAWIVDNLHAQGKF